MGGVSVKRVVIAHYTVPGVYRNNWPATTVRKCMADVDRLLQFQTPQFCVVLCPIFWLYRSHCFRSCEMQILTQTAGIQENTTSLFVLYFQ